MKTSLYLSVLALCALLIGGCGKTPPPVSTASQATPPGSAPAANLPTVQQDAKAASVSRAATLEILDAVKIGDLEKVKSLLKDNPEVVFGKDGDGGTPLHWAAYKGQKEVAVLLLASKAEVDAASESGQTPLHLAACQGDQDMIELLLAKGADVNARNNGGETPVHEATANGHKDAADFLRQHGGIDGKLYYMTGQRIGIDGEKSVPVTLIGGGMPIKPGAIKVDGELQAQLTIKISAFEKGCLIPTEDSSIPLFRQYDPVASVLRSKDYTHAANVTWEFVKKGFSFRAEDGTYEIQSEGATIRFTTDGVKMEGIRKLPN